MAFWAEGVVNYEEELGTKVSRYNTLVSVILYTSRIITLACVVMSSIVGNGGVSLALASALGLAVAIATAVSSTLHEVLVKLESRLSITTKSLNEFMKTKLLLMKVNDKVLEDGTLTKQEYSQLFETLANSITELQQSGNEKNGSS